MSEFPNVSLTTYTEAEDGRAEGIKRFANDLKAWLKNNNLDLEFLSSNLGKSLGTIRNWMTGNINVSDSKLGMILKLCRAHTRGGQGVIYQGCPELEPIDYIWVRPYMYGDSPDNVEEGAPADRARRTWRVGKGRLLYDKWCAAARVPEDTLFNKKALHYPLLAKWVTRVIMGVTGQKLGAYSQLGTLDPSAATDLCLVLQGAPCACSFFAGTRIDKKGVFVEDNNMKAKDICFFLPVVRDEWRGDFARLAARLSGYANTDLWLVERLNEAAQMKLDLDLKCFLQHMKRKEEGDGHSSQ